MPISLGRLFLIFLKVGAFTFGGGYAMIPVFERELVKRFKLIAPEDFYDTLVVCQSLPGPIAVNFAVFTGLRLRGKRGALISLLGVVLPSFIFILLISVFLFRYIDVPIVEAMFKGIRLSVVALIFFAGAKLFMSHRSLEGLCIAVMAFALVFTFSLHPVWVVLMAGAYGILSRRAKGGEAP